MDTNDLINDLKDKIDNFKPLNEEEENYNKMLKEYLYYISQEYPESLDEVKSILDSEIYNYHILMTDQYIEPDQLKEIKLQWDKERSLYFIKNNYPELPIESWRELFRYINLDIPVMVLSINQFVFLVDDDQFNIFKLLFDYIFKENNLEKSLTMVPKLFESDYIDEVEKGLKSLYDKINNY